MSQGDNKALEVVNSIKLKLTDENKMIILTIKNEMRSQGWSKTISGIDVYTAVLDKNIQDVESFKKYLISQGRSL